MSFLFFLWSRQRYSAREGGVPPEGKGPRDEKSDSPAKPESGSFDPDQGTNATEGRLAGDIPGATAEPEAEAALHLAEAERSRLAAEVLPRGRGLLARRKGVAAVLVGLGLLALAGASIVLLSFIQDGRRGVAGTSVPVLSTRSIPSVEGAGPDFTAGVALGTPGEAFTGATGEELEYPEIPSEMLTAGEGDALAGSEGQGEDDAKSLEKMSSQVDESAPAAGVTAGAGSAVNTAHPVAGRPAAVANLSAGRSPYSSSPPPRLAVVIDDWGYDWPAARQILGLKVPLTAAVLPFAPLTREQAEAARQAGFEVILHMPMEPFDGSIPLSAETLRTTMSDETLKELVRRALRAVPQAVGMSNHQGSRATADLRVMRAVLEVVRQEGLFFLDSRTSSQSVALTVARQLGVPAVANRLFIDNDADVAAIEARLWEAVELARREGQAIVIGHVHRSTAIALARTLPAIQKAGIKLVTVSSLVGNQDGQPGMRPAATPAASPHPGTDAPYLTSDPRTSGAGGGSGQKVNEPAGFANQNRNQNQNQNQNQNSNENQDPNQDLVEAPGQVEASDQDSGTGGRILEKVNDSLDSSTAAGLSLPSSEAAEGMTQ